MGESLAQVILLIANLVTFVLFINALMSWFQPDPSNPIRRTLNDICEPIVRPFRNLLPQTGMVDFSAMIAMIAIQVLASVLATLLRTVL